MIGLCKLFSMINNDKAYHSGNSELFTVSDETQCQARKYEQTDIDFTLAYFSKGFNITLFPAFNGTAKNILELSYNAFDNILCAWLSELPLEREIAAFGGKIFSILKTDRGFEEKRTAAEKETQNRLDPDTLAVLKAMAKVYREIERMMGLLRFSPDSEGGFTARCRPDHFVLPALGEYFTSRFGGAPWKVIDEKRRLCLGRRNGEKQKISFLKEEETAEKIKPDDEWEELWKHYHKTINNEDRDNPDLQRQLMPKRYWQFLPEIEK